MWAAFAYAKQFNLPAAVTAFNDITCPPSRGISHGKKIFTPRSAGNTNLGAAVDRAIELKPENALIAVLTDASSIRGFGVACVAG
jgi:hypothetical protein